MPKGIVLRAIDLGSTRLVFEVPRSVTTRAEIEVGYVPVAVREPGRPWRSWRAVGAAPGALSKEERKPKHSKKRLDAVKLASEERPAPPPAVRVVFSIPQKAWRDLVPAVVRAEVAKVAGPVLLGDEEAETALYEWAPLERESIAAGVLRELFGRAGVRVTERFAEEG